MKTCSKCKVEKELDQFPNEKRSKDGKTTSCVMCRSLYNKNRWSNNKEYVSSLNKKSRDKHPEWYVNLRLKDPEGKLLKDREYSNREDIKARRKQKNKENRELDKSYERRYRNEKYQNNPLYRLKILCNSNIRRSFNNTYYKNNRTQNIIGCTYLELKLQFESQFKSWMNWDNQGLYNGELNHGWDIDHIIPLSSAKTEEELLKLLHHSNLQPLCSKINRDIKRDRLDYEKN